MGPKRSVPLVALGSIGIIVLIYKFLYRDVAYMDVVNPNDDDDGPYASGHSPSAFRAYKDGMLPENNFSKEDLLHSVDVRLEKKDVIVFLHIQKTGGTSFGKHLVKNLDIDNPCRCIKHRKRCECYTGNNKIWLFSRYSTGWICGLHADWTELNSCVEDALNKKEKKKRLRRYHYITILRDPVKRYLSEWKHVQRGATWKTARLWCNGRAANLDEFPACYNGTDWSDVTLDEFLDCKSNLGKNRQTRMIADLTKVNCYNSTGFDPEERDQIMLDSAKENLKNMDFFGLTEFQKYTQKLFEYTFSLSFNSAFSQLPVTRSDKTKITAEQKSKILEQNKLDIGLYQFAKDLFLQRVRSMKLTEKDESLTVDYQAGNDEFDDSLDIEDDSDDDAYS